MFANFYQLFVGGGAHSLCTAELAEQLLDRFGSDPSDIVHLRSEPCSVAASAVEGDRQTVGFVANHLNQASALAR